MIENVGVSMIFYGDCVYIISNCEMLGTMVVAFYLQHLYGGGQAMAA